MIHRTVVEVLDVSTDPVTVDLTGISVFSLTVQSIVSEVCVARILGAIENCPVLKLYLLNVGGVAGGVLPPVSLHCRDVFLEVHHASIEQLKRLVDVVCHCDTASVLTSLSFNVVGEIAGDTNVNIEDEITEHMESIQSQKAGKKAAIHVEVNVQHKRKHETIEILENQA